MSDATMRRGCWRSGWACIALVAAGGFTASATVQVPSSARVWVVDPASAPGGTGELRAPLGRLSAAAERSGPGDWIVVLGGELDEGIELKRDQHLVGQGVAVGLPGGQTLPAVKPPSIGDRLSPGIILASGCTVRGLVVHGSPGVLGRGVESVTLADLQIRASSSDGVLLQGVSGAVTLRAVSIAGSGGHGVAVTAGDDESLELKVRDCELVGNRSAGIDIRYTGTGGSVSMEGNQIDGNAMGVVLTHAAADSAVQAVISGNRLNQRRGGSHTALQVFLAAQSTQGSKLAAMVRDNQIGSSEVPGSGSAQGSGIELYASGAGDLTATVADNQVHGIGNGSALRVVSSTHTGALNLTLRGNRLTVAPSDGNALAGLELVAGTTADDAGTLCADVRGNTLLAGDAAGASVTTYAGSPVVELVGYRGAVNDQAAVEAFLDAAADTVTPPASGLSTLAAGTVSGRGTPCPQP